MYWEIKPDTFVPAVSDSMSRNESDCVLRNLLQCDNIKSDNTDKFCKLRLHSMVKINQSRNQWYHTLAHMLAEKNKQQTYSCWL